MGKGGKYLERGHRSRPARKRVVKASGRLRPGQLTYLSEICPELVIRVGGVGLLKYTEAGTIKEGILEKGGENGACFVRLYSHSVSFSLSFPFSLSSRSISLLSLLCNGARGASWGSGFQRQGLGLRGG